MLWSVLRERYRRLLVLIKSRGAWGDNLRAVTPSLSAFDEWKGERGVTGLESPRESMAEVAQTLENCYNNL